MAELKTRTGELYEMWHGQGRPLISTNQHGTRGQVRMANPWEPSASWRKAYDSTSMFSKTITNKRAQNYSSWGMREERKGSHVSDSKMFTFVAYALSNFPQEQHLFLRKEKPIECYFKGKMCSRQ